jgi:hypothetical protein
MRRLSASRSALGQATFNIWARRSTAMPFVLDRKTCWLILVDLSLDAPRRYFPAMALGRTQDISISQQLQSKLKSCESPFTSDAGSEEVIQFAFQAAHGYGDDYVKHLNDWASLIYPNHLLFHDQIFRWRLITMRGGHDGRRDVYRPPPVIVQIRTLLSTFPAISANQIQPVSEWDHQYANDRADDGISPFEWVEAAISTYRFLYAWEVATRGAPTPEQLDQIYHWGVAEAALLQFPNSMIDHPRFIHLPASLQQ